jgi:hypothetical protein
VNPPYEWQGVTFILSANGQRVVKETMDGCSKPPEKHKNLVSFTSDIVDIKWEIVASEPEDKPGTKI